MFEYLITLGIVLFSSAFFLFLGFSMGKVNFARKFKLCNQDGEKLRKLQFEDGDKVIRFECVKCFHIYWY